MSNILIAYFSAGGVTRRAAEEIASATGGDLFEIVPAQPYTAADLDWRDKQSRCTREMTDPASRPAVAGKVDHMDRYDTVFVGFPIWWGVEPRVVDTFLEGYDLTGKTMIPFATSGGSRMPYAQNHLQGLYPGLSWQEGSLVNSGAAEWARCILSK